MNVIEDVNECCVHSLYNIVHDKLVILYGPPSHSTMIIKSFMNAGAKDVIGINSQTIDCDDISKYNYSFNNELKYPNHQLLSALNRIDAKRQAIIYAGSATDVKWVDGRQIIGSRLSRWSALERKQEQTKLLSKQHGDTSLFRSICSLSQKEFCGLCMEFYPCVISGELLTGIEMGSSQVFIINERTINSMTEIYRTLKQKCTGFRISQLTVGLPITVYGFCYGENNICYYPPVVGIVGYHCLSGRIVAPGIIATKKIAVSLTNIFKTVQDVVQKAVKEYGYCGAFGVDGVYQEQKYTIHDFNPRICAGFSFISKHFDRKLPQNIVDILLREDSSNSYEIMTLLKKVMAITEYNNEVIIWNDEALSTKLSNMYRSHPCSLDSQLLQLVFNKSASMYDIISN